MELPGASKWLAAFGWLVSMAPPTYADLGKASRDLFSKGYNFGFIKVDSTTKTGDDVEFKMGASHNIASQNMGGNIDIKYKLPKYGVTFTEKWNTDNALGTEVVVEDKLGKGVKLTIDSVYKPADGKRSGKLKLDYAHDRIRATMDANLDTAGPLVNAALVAEHEGWLLGAAGGFDTKKSQLKSSALALSRCVGHYQLTTFMYLLPPFPSLSPDASLTPLTPPLSLLGTPAGLCSRGNLVVVMLRP